MQAVKQPTIFSTVVCPGCRTGHLPPGGDGAWRCEDCGLEQKEEKVRDTVEKLQQSLAKLGDTDTAKLERFLEVMRFF